MALTDRDKEMYQMIGDRAKELSDAPEVQERMLEIASERGKEEAEKWLYLSAVATLMGL